MIAWCGGCACYREYTVPPMGFSSCQHCAWTPANIEYLDLMKCRCGGTWVLNLGMSTYGCVYKNASPGCGTSVSYSLMKHVMAQRLIPAPVLPTLLLTPASAIKNYACKVCGNECKGGELHTCVTCWNKVKNSYGYKGGTGVCESCVTTNGVGRFVCRPCHESAVWRALGADVSGPPIPFVPTVQYVPASTPPPPTPLMSMAGILSITSANYPFWPGPIAADDLSFSDQTPVPRAYQGCNTCAVELSDYLDAYSGRNVHKAGMCTKCRDRVYGRFCDDDSVSKPGART